jgi:hypothetical protein
MVGEPVKSFILWLAPLVVALGVLRCYTPNDPPPCRPGSVDWPRCDPTQPPWPMAVERHMAPRDAGVDR